MLSFSTDGSNFALDFGRKATDCISAAIFSFAGCLKMRFRWPLWRVNRTEQLIHSMSQMCHKQTGKTQIVRSRRPSALRATPQPQDSRNASRSALIVSA